MERYIQQLLEQFPEDLNYVIKHFPLSKHKFAHQGAMAALAAGKQGKFWEFHGQLLENHDAVSEEKIEQIAAGLELDMARFDQDRRSESSKQLIREDIENGRSIGIKGTPSVFLNGKQVKNPGALPELIRRELRK
ncbi:MAG: thioredoxin domain-containing protein [Desulfosarcina sp.]